MRRATEIVFACHRFAIPGIGHAVYSFGRAHRQQIPLHASTSQSDCITPALGLTNGLITAQLLVIIQNADRCIE
jgi:hypothetical protein